MGHLGKNENDGAHLPLRPCIPGPEMRWAPKLLPIYLPDEEEEHAEESGDEEDERDDHGALVLGEVALPPEEDAHGLAEGKAGQDGQLGD